MNIWTYRDTYLCVIADSYESQNDCHSNTSPSDVGRSSFGNLWYTELEAADADVFDWVRNFSRSSTGGSFSLSTRLIHVSTCDCGGNDWAFIL